jgi:hypothetical protein
LKTSKKCDDGTERYSTTGVPKMFPTMTAFWAKCIATEAEYFEDGPPQ